MNERIKELIKQATHVEEPDGLFSREVFDKEKFAELIVRECQRQVEQYIYECGEIASIPDTVIMKHFGVEEDEDEDDKTCPKCGDSWGGTSCGADCGWITGAEE